MAISAADVKRLRELTGAGMMDCKRALEESGGDFDQAVEYLRIKGAKDIGKRAERTTANGLVAAVGGALVELDCETDFVAKNAEFQELAERIVNVAAQLDAGVTPDGLLAAELGTGTVADEINALSAKIGEKLELRRVAKYDGNTTVYLHKRSADLPPAIGVLVEYTGETESAAEAARGAAMQIASLKARYVSRDEVPADVVDNERRIAEATAREEGKPEAAIAKITEGRLNGFFKEAVLAEQGSVLDSKKTVGALLSAAGVTVTAFTRFEVGTA
ncbi:translation elongation factor Ts [Nakamurella sp.]|uniref:translation elongation factor Ts n=1 Tax=Nakamurella sp. TaxID=1869182 RepID=UPI00378426DC